MPTIESCEVASINSEGTVTSDMPDFSSDSYKDSYSRINAIVIEGEKEAHDNYVSIGTLIPEKAEELKKLAVMDLNQLKGRGFSEGSCTLLLYFYPWIQEWIE